MTIYPLSGCDEVPSLRSDSAKSDPISFGGMTRHSEKGRLWCSRSNWLAARAADHAIQLDGLSNRSIGPSRPSGRSASCSQAASRGRTTLSPYGLYLRLSFSRPSSGFFAVAAIPAARSFAIRSMSFTGTGLVRGNWTVPFRSS
jgi:hypothetical protein